MRVGMLWFDNDRERDFPAKVERAVSYYRRKYGRVPAVCYVHESMTLGQPDIIASVKIRTNNMMLLNHFWLGVEEEVSA